MAFLSVKTRYQQIKAFYQKYERFFMPIIIIWGFVYHYITFKIIPIEEVLYLVFGYLVLATLTILFMHLYDTGKISQKFRYIRLFIPLLLQFSLGSIIGGVFIFYWFSGSIFVSWPFILFVIFLIIAIEAYKHYLEKPAIQFSLYSFSSILLFAVAFPYFFNSLSPWLFIAAGVTSLLLVFILFKILSRYSEELKKKRNQIFVSSAVVFGIMSLFYFFNFIPPVPLSIREAGIYHNIKRSGSGYTFEFEKQNFWQKLNPTPTIHLGPGEKAYMYSSIYTPTDLRTDIIHDWQYYDENKKSWISVTKVSFPVTGGRQEGYRGYSVKTNLTPGTWRTFVETPRGQVLGRFKFIVEKVDTPPTLEKVQN